MRGFVSASSSLYSPRKANPPKDGDAKPWSKSCKAGHDSQAAEGADED